MAVADLETAEATLWSSVGVQPTREMLRIDSIGCSVRAEIAGVGPPVIFVHGGVTAGASWAPLIPLLPDFRCIVIDRPGCGRSELPPGPQSTTRTLQIADDLVAGVMDALDLPKAHVVGTSLGGLSTFRGAAAHPERHDRIVMMSYSVGMRPTGVPLSMRLPMPPFMAKTMMKLVNPTIMRAMLKPAGMKRAIEEGAFADEMIDWMVALLRDTDTGSNEMTGGVHPVTLRGTVEELLFTPELISRITAPTLVLWGAEDPMTTFDGGRVFVESMPDGKIQLVPKAGHAPWVDEPQVAADAVRAHFS